MGLKHFSIEIMRRGLAVKRAPAIGVHPPHGGANAMQRGVELRQSRLPRQMCHQIAAADVVA